MRFNFLHALALAAALHFAPAGAAPLPYPATFQIRDIKTPDATIHVRVGGNGPAVVLLHGFGDTGDMWTPLAIALARDHRVIVPDLRGMGLSSRPAAGYEKRNQAGDVRAVLDALGVDRAVIVGHDIGTMVAFAYAARYRDKTVKLVVMDAPVPGVPPWDQLVRNRALWHFDFGGKDALRLVQGRERIYLDRFWNEFAGDPDKVDESTRAHYAKLYAAPGAMQAAFNQFGAFRKDADDNAEAVKTRLTMPVLAIGGEKSFGATEAVVMRNAATDVTEKVIPNAGHWLMEEAPDAIVESVLAFVNTK